MTRFVESALSRLGLLGLVMVYFWRRKLWWLIPMVFVLLLFGLLIAFAQATAVGPFIYTLF